MKRQKAVRPWVKIENFFHCISAHLMSFAKIFWLQPIQRTQAKISYSAIKQHFLQQLDHPEICSLPIILAGCPRISYFFDTDRFCNYLALLDERTKSKFSNKNERLLGSLRRDHFGNALSDTTRHILNLSDEDLCDTESAVMLHGLNFGLPSSYLCKEEIFAEFESLRAQLFHHGATSVEQHTALKTRLADHLRLHCNSTMDSCDFTTQKQCFCAINSLPKNDDIIVTKPDKGSGIVLLSKSDYVDKINEILKDQTKFKRLSQVFSNDNTASIESRLQKRLLDLVKADIMPK